MILPESDERNMNYAKTTRNQTIVRHRRDGVFVEKGATCSHSTLARSYVSDVRTCVATNTGILRTLKPMSRSTLYVKIVVLDFSYLVADDTHPSPSQHKEFLSQK
jgi:hypothetical protein